MIEVTVDSIRWSMVADYRLLTLKQADAERYLPIYIGPCEADAIAILFWAIETAGGVA